MRPRLRFIFIMSSTLRVNRRPIFRSLLPLLGLLFVAYLWRHFRSGKTHTTTSAGSLQGFNALNNPEGAAHPVKQLHEHAVREFELLTLRQSKSLIKAIDEYERRYKRKPPVGFDHWFHYAKSVDSNIIDDFDTIFDSIEPLWKLDPGQIDRLVVEGADHPYVHSFSPHDKVSNTTKDDKFAYGITNMLRERGLLNYIPDFRMLINLLDEPRVLPSVKTAASPADWTDESRDSSWKSVREPCRRSSKRQQQRLAPLMPDADVDSRGLPFVTSVAHARDVCQNPSYRNSHGFMIRPTTLLTTPARLPMLSQAKLSTFADILYPSVWYFTTAVWDHDHWDLPWENKTNALYWAGATTGQLNKPEEDAANPSIESHRHRFVRLTNPDNHPGHEPFTFLNRLRRKDQFHRTQSDEIFSELYRTKFTRAAQCEADTDCDLQRHRYKFGDPDTSGAAYSYRLLMDLDGNTFSGRFYNFLRSGSCPLKMTVFREWHDDRLVPWLHYVPVSMGMEELPELVRYLSLTEEGAKIARTIADAGSDWHDRALRDDDAAVYMYRLFLEYARVAHPERDSGEMDLKQFVP